MSSNEPNTKLKILTTRHIGWLAAVAILICGIGALVNGPFAGLVGNPISANDENDLSVDPLPVNVLEIEHVDSITQTRSYTGTIRARRRSDLGFEFSGKIKDIYVDEGARVFQGELLAELHIETLEAQKTATAARLAQSKSVLDELYAGPRVETIAAARAEAEAAKSRFDIAVLNLKRRNQLLHSGAISDEELDQATFSERTTKANFEAAQQRLSELEEGTREEQLAGQQSVVKQLEASAKEIDVAINKSRLVAPFTGTVTRRYLDPGSIAQASTPVIKLVEQNHLEAWIGLPVSIVADLELGSCHEIQIDEKSFWGMATAKIQELDPVTRTQTVVFDLQPESSDQVVSGQLCEIQVSSEVDSSGFWVPTSALTKGIRGLWSVMALVPDSSGRGFRIQKSDIEIIKTEAGRVLAEGTIQQGDQIVRDGTHRTSEGQWVILSENNPDSTDLHNH